MPTWLGLGAFLVMLLRRPILSWVFGLFKREFAFLMQVPAEERLQREAAAARKAAAQPVPVADRVGVVNTNGGRRNAPAAGPPAER